MKIKDLKTKSNIKLGFKLSLVSIIPGSITALLMIIFKFQYEPMTFLNGIVGIILILLNFYLSGFFVNKWKKWIFN